MWSRKQKDLEREIQAHLETEAEELRDAGLSGEEAQFRARRALGNRTSIQEACREVWGFLSWEQLARDVRFAVRNLSHSRVYVTVAIATLAIGIGANSAIFSLVRGVLLRPLDYQDPDRLVTVLAGKGSQPLSPANFLDLAAQNTSFERMAAASAWFASLSGESRPEQVIGLQLSEGMFELLGVRPALGRWPNAEEHRPGKERVVLLSHGLWQRRYGGSASVIGRSLRLNGEAYTVIGVMGPSFQFTPFWVTGAELWVPFTTSDKATQRGAQFLRSFARLKPRVSVDQAQREMQNIAERLAAAYPRENAKLLLYVEPLQEKVVGNVRTALLVMLGAVGFVLLLACSNMANLALARGTERQKEIAIRMALGAGRGRLLRQLLTESLLIAVAGGLLGLALAWWGVDALKLLIASGSDRAQARVPRVGEASLDGVVLAFTAAISMLAGILFGIVPAWQATRTAANASLKEGTRGASDGSPALRLRGLLMAGEVAISLVLLTGAGLLLRSFLSLRAIDPGFDPRNVLTMTVSLAGLDAYKGAAREQFYRSVVEDVRALPGVVSASMVNHIPIGGDTWGYRIRAEGQPAPRPGEQIGATYRVGWPDYFRTMGIRLVRGRDFEERDRPSAPKVVIINQALAQRLWGDADPIGRRVTTADPPQWMTVVGVIRNVRQQNWEAEPGNEFCLPFAQAADFYNGGGPWTARLTLVVRTSGDPLALSNSVRSVVWSRDSNVPVSDVRSMEQIVGSALWSARFQLLLLGVFAGFALALAAVGMYGVVAYGVSRRSHEIGIRMALGAQRGAVIWMVMRQSLLLVAAGVAVGLVLALALARSLSTLLYGVEPTDPLTFLSIPLLLAMVALVAAYLPARHASLVDPVIALRRG